MANLACGSKLSERRLQTTSQVPLPPSKMPSDWGSLLERPCRYQSLHSRWRQLLQSGISKGLDLRQNMWRLFCFGLVCFLVVFLWRERKGEETNTFSKTTPGMFKQLFIYLTCILWLLCFSWLNVHAYINAKLLARNMKIYSSSSQSYPKQLCSFPSRICISKYLGKNDSKEQFDFS